MDTFLAERIVADDLAASLKNSLRSGKSTDCEDFIRLAQPVVASAIVRTLSRWGRPDRERVDDLVQDTFARLYDKNARALRNFESDDSAALAAWLRTVAASVTLDSMRAQLAKRRGDGQAPQSLEDPGIAVPSQEDTFQQVERTLFTERIGRCLESQKQRDRSIFWLYYKQGFTAKDISEVQLLGIGTKGVETTIYRVTRAVRDCLGRSGGLATTEGNRR